MQTDARRECRLVESGPAGAPVDEQIIDYAKREGCMVMTNDRR